MAVRIVEQDAELVRIAPVMLQLRPTYSEESLVAQIAEQRAQGFQVAYVESEGEVLCVAGFVIGLKLATGKYLYVDDLVTAADQRSRGAGAVMIAWLKSRARSQGCKQLHLDSGVQRFAAHKFYFREGFSITSHHFAITDLAG
jgi:GNAT superfamily N-acetyltransferase